MAFIVQNNQVLSFAEYQDVIDRDQRLFDSNEGLSDDVVEPLLIRATERLLSRFRATSWWQNYYRRRGDMTAVRSPADIPALDATRIQARQNDFTDLCVYQALSEFILPSVANFGQEANEEREKMGYYQQKADSLFGELVAAGDWYDFDNDGSVENTETAQGVYNLRRVR
jgi:hypothetical protein